MHDNRNRQLARKEDSSGEWLEKRAKIVGFPNLDAYRIQKESDWNKIEEKANKLGFKDLKEYGIYNPLNWHERRAFMQQLGLEKIMNNLTRKELDWRVRESLAKTLGYHNLKDYEIHKELGWAPDNIFNGVIIYPIDQIYLIQTVSDAVECPELLMKGMDYRVDYTLMGYLPMIRSRGLFVGYKNMRIELQQREFPCGIHDRDYEAVEELLLANGWEQGPDGWTKE
jgi:hypothetical protein